MRRRFVGGRGATRVGAALALTVALAGCSGTLNSPGGPASAPARPAAPTRTLTTSAMPDVTHFYLDSARRKLTSLGLRESQVVNSTLGENSLVVKPSNWIVLTQDPPAGGHISADSVIHLGVVKLSDPKARGISPRS